jgi:ADP-ribosyl-[dinitrogen reductase] hydrolase
MIAGIVGDVLGSVYEAHQWTRSDLALIQHLPFDTQTIVPLFDNLKWVRKNYSWTDDTLCSLALYHAWRERRPATESLLYFCRLYGNETIGFGKAFNAWLDNPVPYQSLGNGALMRLGFLPYLPLSLKDKQQLGYEYTAVSHNHPDSFQAVHDFIYLTHTMALEDKQDIQAKKDHIARLLAFHEFDKTVQSMHEENIFEMNCLQTLLQSCVIVLESDNMEEVYRNSFYVGGDSDTLACIAGNIASWLFTLPENHLDFAFKTLEPFEDLHELANHFKTHYWKN